MHVKGLMNVHTSTHNFCTDWLHATLEVQLRERIVSVFHLHFVHNLQVMKHNI